MRMKEGAMYIAMGIGGTLLYQQMMNGNINKMMRDVKRLSKKTIDDLEDMM